MSYTYSDKIVDSNQMEFRSVSIARADAPGELARAYQNNTTFSELTCRELGITQSPGWEHYGYFKGNTSGYVLLFRRPFSQS